MAFEVIDRCPQVTDFVPLTEHEVQTPGTFFGGRPVLHFHAPATNLKISSQDFLAQADVRKLAGSTAPTSDVNGSLVIITDVDVWVTSRFLTLFARATGLGLQIPYPTIGVTAQDGGDVLLELNLSDADTADEVIEFMQMRIAGGGAADDATTTTTTTTAATLFKAISDCQELNPDPVRDGDDDDDDENGGPRFDATAPGATGWITSENMNDFLDADGNFRLPSANNDEGFTVIGGDTDETGVATNGEAGLGEGAGRTRTAAEMGGDDGADGDESKWQRTG